MVGKGEYAGYQHFLLFTQCFQKDFFFKSSALNHTITSSNDIEEEAF